MDIRPSTQFTGVTAALAGLEAQDVTFLPPSVSGGRVRNANFDWTFVTGTTAAESTVAIALIPAGVTLIGLLLSLTSTITTGDITFDVYDTKGVALLEDIVGNLDTINGTAKFSLPVNGVKVPTTSTGLCYLVAVADGAVNTSTVLKGALLYSDNS